MTDDSFAGSTTAIRSISIRYSGFERRVTPISVLGGRPSPYFGNVALHGDHPLEGWMLEEFGRIYLLSLHFESPLKVCGAQRLAGRLPKGRMDCNIRPAPGWGRGVVGYLIGIWPPAAPRKKKRSTRYGMSRNYRS